MTKKRVNSQNSFEDDLKRLQNISEALEGDDISLEESVKLFEEGINLSKNCYTKLNEAELKIEELKKQIQSDINYDEDIED
ncbi:MAG: exodeoxyribonuclease VII small subunit [Melioribacteraceae bacterium]|nr:exodeoxyribonuclease VII small subunit [Melioribacteraceae bacterium]MCF8265645.1 exodeoxyribonuclease VII small subunit [Melioribacteraceae bacterium]MCF8414272.1 exodeoxyribonuclease VII small subunit [Melioribacteraceae bacterium]MCF8432465.1 exodeoxyribonuclease VII small subunit [Melioribacteraceae bacterium]